LAIQF